VTVKISDSELEILKIIWGRGDSVMFSEIVDELHNKNFEWKNNTVLTFLSRLTEKNYLKVRKKGRRNEYIAIITEQDYLQQETEDFVSKFYEGEVTGLIATLVQNNLLSDDDYEELKKYWENENE
jgi:BlaI family penicillinase repressor